MPNFDGTGPDGKGPKKENKGFPMRDCHSGTRGCISEMSKKGNLIPDRNKYPDGWKWPEFPKKGGGEHGIGIGKGRCHRHGKNK